MNTKKITGEKILYLIITIVSITLVVFCSLSLLNYMVEYKYHIDENFDHTDLVYSYKSRKIEIETITGYLKFFIAYLIIITSYFLYRLFSKK
jgi:hypothetical protein